MLINNPFAMVVAIIAIVMLAKVARTFMTTRARRDAADRAEDSALRSQAQVDALARRVEVLERLVTDKDRGLADEIERLRRRDPPDARI
ncbi:hypothetical protein GC169_01995 [bacterium]|nr:hypothetical protein [bacterium]